MRFSGAWASTASPTGVATVQPPTIHTSERQSTSRQTEGRRPTEAAISRANMAGTTWAGGRTSVRAETAIIDEPKPLNPRTTKAARILTPT